MRLLFFDGVGEAKKTKSAVVFGSAFFCVISFFFSSLAFAEVPIYLDFNENVTKQQGDAISKALVKFAEQGGYLVDYKFTGAAFKQALNLIGCPELEPKCFDKLAATANYDQLAYVSVEKLTNSTLLRIVLNRYDAATRVSTSEEHHLKISAELQPLFFNIVEGWGKGYPILTSFVAKGPKSYDLKIEGADFGKLPRALTSLYPDNYTVVVESEGKPVASKVVAISLDKPARLTVAGEEGENKVGELEIIEEQAPKPELTLAERFEEVRTSSWVTTSVGMGTLLIGGGFALGGYFLNQSAEDVVTNYCQGIGGDSNCPASIRTPNRDVQRPDAGKYAQARIDYDTEKDRSNMMWAASYATFGIGAAVTAVGLGMVIYDLTTAPREGGPYYLKHKDENKAPLPVADASMVEFHIGASLNYVHANLRW